MAHILANDLRAAVLKAAIQGRLTKHNDSDTNVIKTIKQIKDEKTYLFKSKKINKEKPFSKSDKYVETPFDIPDTWEWIRFGDLMINKDSYRVPVSKAERAKKEKVYDYYGASGVIDKIDSYIFDEPNLLIGEDGANLLSRSTPIAFVAHGKYWVNNHAHVLNTCAGVSLKFVTLYINAIDLSPYVSGTAQPKMNQENMNAIWVALPPIEEQARIVAKVDEIMAKIDEYEKLENQLVKLKEQFPQDMKESLLQAGMMGKLTEQLESDTIVDETSSFNTLNEQRFDIPKVWTWFNLKDLMSICTGKKDQNFATRDGAYNFYTCAKEVFKAPNYSFEGESLILPGNGANVGTVTLYNGKFEAYQRTYVLQSINKTINMKFMYYCLLENWNRYNKNKMFGSAIPYIKLGNLQNYPVALPPIEEQQRIVDKLDELLPLVDKLAELN